MKKYQLFVYYKRKSKIAQWRENSRRQLSFPGGAICKLCQSHHSLVLSPVDWKNEQACMYVLSLKVSSDSLVRKPCRDDITRVLANPCYVPRWEKGKASSKTSNCCVVSCNNTVFAASAVGTIVMNCRMHLTEQV